MSSQPGQGIDTVLTRPTLPQRGEIAKLVATTVSTLSGLDAEVSLRTADNAVRYNFLHPSHNPEVEKQRAEMSLQNGEKLSATFEEAWKEATTEVPSMVQFRDRIIEATQDPLLGKAPGLKAEFQSKSQKYVNMVPTTRLEVATNIPGPGTVLKSGGIAFGLGVKALKMGKTAEVANKAAKVTKVTTNTAKVTIPSTFPLQAKRYIEDMTTLSGMEIPKNQRDLLGEAVRNKNYVKLEGQAYRQHAQPYKNPRLKNKLIQEWETNTGQKWPTYQEPIYSLRTGNKLKDTGDLYDAHHIIPQQHGGPHEWWNMHPLKMGEDHQGQMHGPGSLLTKIINEANQ